MKNNILAADIQIFYLPAAVADCRMNPIIIPDKDKQRMSIASYSLITYYHVEVPRVINLPRVTNSFQVIKV